MVYHDAKLQIANSKFVKVRQMRRQDQCIKSEIMGNYRLNGRIDCRITDPPEIADACNMGASPSASGGAQGWQSASAHRVFSNPSADDGFDEVMPIRQIQHVTVSSSLSRRLHPERCRQRLPLCSKGSRSFRFEIERWLQDPALAFAGPGLPFARNADARR